MLGQINEYSVQNRQILVWTPSTELLTTDPWLLVMLDGENVFYPQRSHFNKAWQVQDVIAQMDSTNFDPPIIVAIENGSNCRYSDYAPQDLLDVNPEVLGTFEGYLGIDRSYAPTGNKFQSFLQLELFNYLERKLSTTFIPKQTAILGASMGAIGSLVAAIKSPNRFEMAIAMSTGWPALGETGTRLLIEQLPKKTKYWFDQGDVGLDAEFLPLQKYADQLFVVNGLDVHTQVFKDANHDEISWAQRLPQALLWWQTKQK